MTSVYISVYCQMIYYEQAHIFVNFHYAKPFFDNDDVRIMIQLYCFLLFETDDISMFVVSFFLSSLIFYFFSL